eukprot:6469951-Amphidinium_carterae.1
MTQTNYIKFHPTTGYHRATEEIRRFYDGFQIYNSNDKFNPQRPIDDNDNNPATLQQLLSIRYYYAPNFFDALKNQKLDNQRHRGWEEQQVQMQETVLRNDKIMELYIILPEKALEMWLQLPGSFMENGTEEKHFWYQLPHRATVRDQRLHQPLFVQLPHGLLTIRSTVDKTVLLLDSGPHDRTTTGSTTRRAETFARTEYEGLEEAILDKPKYKPRHFHDDSAITTDIDVNEEYATQMIIDIYAQAAKKPGGQPPHQNRFILFMIQHHATRITKIMKDAGLPQPQINMAFEYFDDKAHLHFNNPNLRNLTDMQQRCCTATTSTRTT